MAFALISSVLLCDISITSFFTIIQKDPFNYFYYRAILFMPRVIISLTPIAVFYELSIILFKKRSVLQLYLIINVIALISYTLIESYMYMYMEKYFDRAFNIDKILTLPNILYLSYVTLIYFLIRNFMNRVFSNVYVD